MKPERHAARNWPKWMRRLHRAWRSLRGETWVYLELHCFGCDSGYAVEIREEWAWPLIGRCKCENPHSIKSCTWNSAPVFPIESQRQSPGNVWFAKTGEHLTVEQIATLEAATGYGKKWWQTETVEAVRNRRAVRKEHEE